MGRKLKDKKKISALMWECYEEFYKEASPSVSFKELWENAPLNNKGEKMIEYEAYYLSTEKYMEIFNKYMDRISDNTFYKRSFHFAVATGPSPMSNKERWEEYVVKMKLKDLVENQENLDPDIVKMVDKEFWNLI